MFGFGSISKYNSAPVTLMSSDVERVRRDDFWANPVQMVIRQLVPAFAVPLVVVFICIISSSVLIRFIGAKQEAWMQAIQKRVEDKASIIGNMKHLKIFGLTKPAEDAIEKLRVDELETGGKFRIFLVGSVEIGFTPVLLGPVFAFTLMSGQLNVTTTFTSLSYLQLLSTPLSLLFQVLPHLFAVLSCLSRIQAFLKRETRHDESHVITPDMPSENGHASEKLLFVRGDQERRLWLGKEDVDSEEYQYLHVARTDDVYRSYYL
ncbi:hypothetical protein N7495_007488 [Penicillium taxi]|uniref:uncharacterized protein n=1 Tax=Penicillium taxi TaxID=168475 RepID=UPI0025457668|nr:uncharacterized protein N7495_007488 [Penicillium taxi]KAJ5887447.1 hypothetical protein N7495_007488 [Penicillium taxi]